VSWTLAHIGGQGTFTTAPCTTALFPAAAAGWAEGYRAGPACQTVITRHTAFSGRFLPHPAARLTRTGFVSANSILTPRCGSSVDSSQRPLPAFLGRTRPARIQPTLGWSPEGQHYWKFHTQLVAPGCSTSGEQRQALAKLAAAQGRATGGIESALCFAIDRPMRGIVSTRRKATRKAGATRIEPASQGTAVLFKKTTPPTGRGTWLTRRQTTSHTCQTVRPD